MAENNEDKNTGKYIDILNICANKENESGPVEDPSVLTKQFTAEEFNGIVRALQELYESLNTKLFQESWIVFEGVNIGQNSKTFTTKLGEKNLEIKFQYLYRERNGFKGAWNSVPDSCHFTVKFKKLGSNVPEEIIYNSKDVNGEEIPLENKTDFSLDITDKITSGGKYEFVVEATSNSKVSETGEVLKANFYYTIVVTNMSLSFKEEEGSEWWGNPFPYKEGGFITVPFEVSGTGNRKVLVTINGAGYKQPTTDDGYYTKVVTSGGTSQLNFDIPLQSRSQNGILKITAFMQSMDDLSVRTEEITREVIVLKSEKLTTDVKLMAINDFKSTVKGGINEVLFKYAVYDSLAVDNTSVVFTTKVDDAGEISTNTGDVITVPIGQVRKFEYDLGTISSLNESYLLKISAKNPTGSKSFIKEEKVVTVDNSSSYSPVTNAIWYMNPTGRNNQETRREEIKNVVNNSYFTAKWNNVSWSENDGWYSTTESDSKGNTYSLSCLRLLSGSSVEINYQPLLIGNSNSRTIEFDYKISNISNSSIPAIIISKESTENGIKIYPNEVVTGVNSFNSADTRIATDDNVRLRVTITVSANSESYLPGKSNKFVRIYINGIIAKVYEATSSMNNIGNIILGSTGCDIDIYSIRIYDTPLTKLDVIQNYINRLNTIEEKDATVENNRIFADDSNRWQGIGEIDFKNTVDQYNVFVFDGDNWPSKNNEKASKGNLEFYSINNIGGLADKVGNSYKITNVEVKGQGTSSKEYYEWNLQFKTGDNTEYWPLRIDEKGQWYEDKGDIIPDEKHGRVDKDGEPVLGEDGEQIMDPVYSNVTYSKKIPLFANVPPANSIVMKKNWASSMQDHKMGSVNSFTDTWKKLGFKNKATEKDPTVRVSVYQEPMIGFWKKTNQYGEVTYECKGLFTGGPHKGDKQCFGYSEKYGADLISIEGSTNGSVFAEFKVPWNNSDDIHVEYDASEELFTYDRKKAWDYNYGKAEEPEEILALFRKTFHEAYNFVYECGLNLLPFEGTGEELIEAVNNGTVDLDKDYWVSDYTLYHVFTSEAPIKVEKVDTGKGEVNIYEMLKDIKYDFSFTKGAGVRTYVPGTKTVAEGIAEAASLEEKNDIFKKARIVRFRDGAGEYWDLEDAIFHHCWIEFFAGSDQRTKNTYPYSYQERDPETNKLTELGKWKWRLDDADTIGAINNTGIINKKYSVEVHDIDESGNVYFNGLDNQFWNLIETLEDKYYVGMNNLLNAFLELSDVKGGNGTTTTTADRLFGFYEKYFLSVKKYFPEAAYNLDSNRYEEAYQASVGKPAAALQQILGNAYSAESNWFKNRIQYITSKYAFGDFNGASTANTFNSRAAGSGKNNEVRFDNLTIGFDHYPTMDIDGDFFYYNNRHFAGDTFSVVTNSAGDRSLKIHGASFFTDLGDIHNINFDNKEMHDFSVFKSIKRLLLGCENRDEIVSRMGKVSFPTAVETLYLKNCFSLTESIGLDECILLKDIDATGTSLPIFKFANGAPLESVKLPATTRNLQFLNCTRLEQSNIILEGMEKIDTIYIINSPKINAIRLVKETLEKQKNLAYKPLKYINIQGIDVEFTGQESVEVLRILADLTDTEKSFCGVYPSGDGNDTSKPTITGKIKVEYAYKDDENDLEAFFPGLDITVGTYYIRFADEEYLMPKLKKYMVSCKWMEETETISEENAPKLTSFSVGGSSSIFREDNRLTSFDELVYFTGYTTVYGSYDWNTYSTNSDFYGCENLKSINLENIVNIGEGGFKSSGIERVYAPKLTSLSTEAFFGCKNLKVVQSLGTTKVINTSTFEGCSSLTTVILPKECTAISDSAFSGCTSLKSIYLPNNLENIGSYVFNNSSLETLYWNYTGQGRPKAPIQGGFGTNIKIIYVNEDLYDKINSTTSWNPYVGLVQLYDFEKDPNGIIPEEHKK